VKKDSIAKAATTKKMNQLAGARLSLPGHNAHRETALRLELTASFKPQDTGEMLWVHDIAYCTTGMEVTAAQIAALQRRHLAWACSAALSETPPASELGGSHTFEYSPQEREWLQAFADGEFTASYNHTLLNDATFASLLGSVSKGDIETLRMLQQLLHDERKERDRIINQLERRRRNAMRDAIELAEEARRKQAFQRLYAERAASVATGRTSPKLVSSDTVDRVLIDDDGSYQSDDDEVIDAPDVSNAQ
jgi:hypothetical protein